MIVAKVVRDVKRHFFLRSQEWMLTFGLLQFGLCLLRPGFSFDVSSSYAAMQRVASEDTWATGILIVAGLRFTALVVNGTFARFRRASPYVRSCTAVLSGITWASIAMGIIWSDGPFTGGGTYTVWACMDFLVGFMVVGEAAAAEKAHRNGRTSSTD